MGNIVNIDNLTLYMVKMYEEATEDGKVLREAFDPHLLSVNEEQPGTSQGLPILGHQS